MTKIEEFDYMNSERLLTQFQHLESPTSFGADWYNAENDKATYIWLLEEENEKPLGFLSYKKFILPNKIAFIYILKIYALKSYRGENPTLIEDEKVSKILFRQIHQKGINILTLESSCDKLDIYYGDLGFKSNKEISNIFAPIIQTNELIMYKIIDKNNFSEKENKLFLPHKENRISLF